MATDASLSAEGRLCSGAYLATNGCFGLRASFMRAGMEPVCVGELKAIYLAMSDLSFAPMTIMCDSIQALGYVRSWLGGAVDFPKRYRRWREDGRPSDLEILRRILYRNPAWYAFELVKGHSGHPLNEAAHELARLGLWEIRDGGYGQQVVTQVARERAVRALKEFA